MSTHDYELLLLFLCSWQFSQRAPMSIDLNSACSWRKSLTSASESLLWSILVRILLFGKMKNIEVVILLQLLISQSSLLWIAIPYCGVASLFQIFQQYYCLDSLYNIFVCITIHLPTLQFFKDFLYLLLIMSRS